MLDLYFDATDPLLRHEFGPFIFALPENDIRKRIRVESHSESELRRDAAKIATRILQHRWRVGGRGARGAG